MSEGKERGREGVGGKGLGKLRERRKRTERVSKRVERFGGEYNFF